jgi:membrane protein YqaA with SNARE-associated domain
MATDDELTAGEIRVENVSSDRVASGGAGKSFLEFLSRHPKWVQIGIWSVVIGSTGISIVLSLGGFMDVSDAGYLATFYLNLIGAATIILPLPGVLAACVAAESSLGLNLVLVGLVGAAGSTLGEITAYLAGYAGHNAVTNLRWYPRIHDLMERRGGVTLFLVSFIPTPFFDLAGIAAGALNYPFRKFMVYVFTGKAIRLTMMAYACRQGIDWLKSIYEFNWPL